MFIFRIILTTLMVTVLFLPAFLLGGLVGGLAFYFFNLVVGIFLFIIFTLLGIFFLILCSKKDMAFITCPCGEVLQVKTITFYRKQALTHFFDDSDQLVKYCPSCNEYLYLMLAKGEEGEEKLQEKKDEGLVKKDLAFAVMKVANPLLEEYPEKIPVVVDCTILVWNLSILSKKKQYQKKREVKRCLMENNFGPSRQCKEYVELLWRRKNKLFPEDRRKVLSYQIEQLGERYQLQIEGVEESDEGSMEEI